MPTREKKIFSGLKHEVDAIVLMNATDPNLDYSFFYSTGIPNGLFEGALAVIRRNRTEVVCSELEELSAREAGVKTTVFETRGHREELMKKMLKGCERIGINSDELTHANYLQIKRFAEGAKLVNVSEDIQNARMVKEADEILRIKKACNIASITADEIPNMVDRGMTETEAAAEINYKMMRLGASGPAFLTISAFGKGSAEPHYFPSPLKTLSKGQFALFDFGAANKRYVSDITRTFVCSKPTSEQKLMYETVLQAQAAALEAVKDGAHGKDVDRAARNVIDRSKYKGLFIHGTGHGLGICAHDPGHISAHKDMMLREGMVLTVEPGVYVKDFGGVRIEDDVLVTKNGCRVLTSASRNFRSL